VRRHGTILVGVLVIIALAAMAAGILLHRARAEITAATASSRKHQAYSTALSGLRRAMAIIKAAPDDLEVWYDNPDLFRGQLVAEDGVNTWYFTIYAYNPSDPDHLRHGLTDEGAKINLNAIGPDTLILLLDRELRASTDVGQGAAAELADCLIDYRDRDEDTSPLGAEQDYYDQLPFPYLIKNGPLATVEELLLVKGFHGPLVYGEDYNLNGLLEDNEDDGEGDSEDSFPPDNADGVLARGLLGIATVWSYELNVDTEGKRRANLNTARNIDGLGLPEETVEFVELCREEGVTFDHPAELLEMRYQLKQDHGRRQRAGQWIDSGVGARELPDVLDRLTTQGPIVQGLVNVNTAPAEVLAVLPGFDEDVAERVVGARGTLDPATMSSPAWLYTENIVSADRFKEMAPLLTTRSRQFRVRCTAYGWPCGQFRTIEAVIDVAMGSPRIVYQRDLTRLGMPFPINIEQEERSQ
jgi:type II secretory pathway component PulK